jgi:hypothetical protein
MRDCDVGRDRRTGHFQLFDQAAEDDPTPVIHRFVARGVWEETGVDLRTDPGQVILFGLGHDSWSLQPALIGYLELDMSREQFEERFRLAPDREEFERYLWLPMDPEECWETIHQLKSPGRNDRILPWAELTLYLTLVGYYARKGWGLSPITSLFGPDGRGWP